MQATLNLPTDKTKAEGVLGAPANSFKVYYYEAKV